MAADGETLAAARRALAAARLPFADGADHDEIVALLARLLALIGPRLGTPTRARLPAREAAALLRAAKTLLEAEHRLRDAADRPPPLPTAYLDALLAWSERVSVASGRGAPERGAPFGARPIVSVFVRAFGRRPSPKIGGPAYRFVAECLGAAGAPGSARHRTQAILHAAGDVGPGECLAFLREHETFEDWLARILSAALAPDA